jgi:hypothetical protein
VQSKPQRPTSRHHYLPEFYLKRWTGSNGKLIEFTWRERLGVVSRSTAPGGTGWQKDLYKAEGMPPEVAYAFEEHFFAL